MCRGCWQEHGNPTIVNNAVLSCVASIKHIYTFSSVGGALHIALDDWNIDDSDLNFCEDWANARRKDEAQYAAEMACIEQLRGLTETERASALAIAEGFFAPTTTEMPK